MLFVLIWLASVTGLLIMMAYQSYVDHNEIQEMIEFMGHNRNDNHHQHNQIKKLTEDIQHQHDHIQRIESSIQDMKIKRIKRKKKKNTVE